MGKRLFAVVVAAVFAVLGLSCDAFAETKTDTSKTGPVVASGPKGASPQRAMRPNFGMVGGTISKIDNSKADDVKLEVTSQTDGKTHMISVTPFTNVTKLTDISELKSGDEVRIMTRKVDDKDVAMNIMFGKVKARPMPMGGPGAVPVAKPAAAKQQSVKK